MRLRGLHAIITILGIVVPGIVVLGTVVLGTTGCTGCIKPGAFQCASSTECVRAGQPGTCEAVGYCSFPDSSCAGGSRFGGQSGPYANACVGGGDGGVDDSVPGLISIGGAVSGLAGSGLVVRNNEADDLPIVASGPFTFPTLVLTGEPYAVTVSSQPASPAQTCSVAGGTGFAGTADINDVEITCATTSYAIGGTVVGLVGSGLVLTNNGGDDRSIAASGAFQFATPIASGAAYNVAIKTQPIGQTCVVSGATGTVGIGNVASVVVNCVPGTYTIGGTVNGLVGTAVLRNNGGDDLTLTSTGSFAFATPLAPATGYAVTVLTSPAYPPRSQTCVVGSGTGVVGAANVTTITVNCTTNLFTVGGTVSGLSGTLVLENNGADMRSVTASGAFAFAAPLASASTYNVTIKTQPTDQACAITAGGSGTVTNGNVTGVTIQCMVGSDPGILCGSTYCDPAVELCCVTNGVPACASSCNGNGKVPIACDTQQDCATAGTPALVCCGSVTGTTVNSIYCGKASLCTPPKAYYCDPNIATPCPDGGTCEPTTTPPGGFYRCF